MSDCFGIILVHGGAGNIPDSVVPEKLEGVLKSAEAGARTLLKSRSALRSVCEAIVVMEDKEAFNAGYGSVLNEDGEVEMDAAVMTGNDLEFGGVCAVGRIKNPILAAEAVLEKSEHCLLASEGGLRFAEANGLEIVEAEDLISPRGAKSYETKKRTEGKGGKIRADEGISNEMPGERDTVGAVAMDLDGTLAAGTSTGGLMMKSKGRVGDTPVIGAGLYADKLTGAVSTTGLGECLLRHLVAWRIAQKLPEQNDLGRPRIPEVKLKREDARSNAVEVALDDMTSRVGGDGGAIAIDANGRITIGFNSRRMSWAYAIVRENSKAFEVHYGCNRGEDFVKEFHV